VKRTITYQLGRVGLRSDCLNFFKSSSLKKKAKKWLIFAQIQAKKSVVRQKCIEISLKNQSKIVLKFG